MIGPLSQTPSGNRPFSDSALPPSRSALRQWMFVQPTRREAQDSGDAGVDAQFQRRQRLATAPAMQHHRQPQQYAQTAGPTAPSPWAGAAKASTGNPSDGGDGPAPPATSDRSREPRQIGMLQNVGAMLVMLSRASAATQSSCRRAAHSSRCAHSSRSRPQADPAPVPTAPGSHVDPLGLRSIQTVTI
jgi:hypothetical protein